MKQNTKITGLDMYLGTGASYDDVWLRVAEVFSLPKESLSDYNSPNAHDVVKFGRWAFIHELADSAELSHKVDVELFRDFDWGAAARSLSTKLGVPVFFPNEKDANGDSFVAVYPDGTSDLKALPSIEAPKLD